MTSYSTYSPSDIQVPSMSTPEFDGGVKGDGLAALFLLMK